MKRGGPLKRKKRLQSKAPLRASSTVGYAPYPEGFGTGIFAKPRKALSRKTRLAPISPRQREKKAARAAQVKAEGENFKRAVAGHDCIVCGRSEAEAYEATGFGHQAHHGIRKEVLKRLGLERLLWAPGNALAVCDEPCHRQHTSRKKRILRGHLPKRFVQWCVQHGLEVELEKEYRA